MQYFSNDRRKILRLYAHHSMYINPETTLAAASGQPVAETHPPQTNL